MSLTAAVGAGDATLPIRFGWNEWLGALGDVGIFIPIYLSLVALNGMNPIRPLLLVGLAYILTSLFFRVPTPVQPLKAMAAIVIAQGLGMPELYAAAIWLGAILILLAAFRKVEWLAGYFPPAVVKGIQLGVGLMLLSAAWKLLNAHTGAAHAADAHPSRWPFYVSALWILVIPQIPLTLGNAVFALCDASRSYFGRAASRVTAANVAASIGVTDVLMGMLGGLPICHGSGGLTAHVRFGARTAGATILTGAFYILLAIVFGAHASSALKIVPHWIFAVMLAYVGICHAMLVKDLMSKTDVAIAAVMGIIAMATENLAYALAFGLVAVPLVRLIAARRRAVA